MCLRLEQNLILVPQIIKQTTKKIKIILEKIGNNLKHTKSYVVKKIKHLNFQEDYHVWWRVTPITKIGKVMKKKNSLLNLLAYIKFSKK